MLWNSLVRISVAWLLLCLVIVIKTNLDHFLRTITLHFQNVLLHIEVCIFEHVIRYKATVAFSCVGFVLELTWSGFEAHLSFLLSRNGSRLLRLCTAENVVIGVSEKL